MFNLQTALKDGFQVQRDIFTRDGVGVQANDRMTSIKVSEGSKQSYLLLNNSASNIQPDNLNTIKLRANQSKHLQLKTGSIIFSELHEFKLDGIRLQADEAYRFNESHTINVESKKDQFLLIYHSK